MKLNILLEIQPGKDHNSAQTLVEFEGNHYRVDTFYRPDTSVIGNTAYQTNSEGTACKSVNLLSGSTLNHTNAILALEDKLVAELKAKRAKRNRAARERYDVMRALGLKRTPYGWE